jgi:nucleoside-triphosphatase THEP1
MPEQHPPDLTVLTGPSGTGKTSACLGVADLAANLGLRVAGIVSPAVFVDGVKTAIDCFDLQSGQRRRLATRVESPAPGELGYRFAESTVTWANAALARATPCDLLLVDEIGPLELVQGKGLVTALAALRSGAYGQAVVVVRPELIQRFLATVGTQSRIVEAARWTPGEGASLLRLIVPKGA